MENNVEGNTKPDVYAEKRKKALEYLGKKWLMHPDYVFNPKHRIETRHIGTFNKKTERNFSR